MHHCCERSKNEGAFRNRHIVDGDGFLGHVREGICDDAVALILKQDRASLVAASSDDSAVPGDRSVNFISDYLLEIRPFAESEQKPAESHLKLRITRRQT